MLISAAQNEKLLKAINSSIIELLKLGFNTELRLTIEPFAASDEKNHSIPSCNPAYVKHINEAYKNNILQLATTKLAVNDANTATATAAIPNANAVQVDTKQAAAANVSGDQQKIKTAITHFIRLRLLFLGMTVGNHEYVCVDPTAPLKFPDAKEQISFMPLRLDLLDPKAKLSFADIQSEVVHVVEEMVGGAPIPYATTVGILEEDAPDLRDSKAVQWVQLNTGGSAAYVYFKNGVYYFNPLSIPKRCDLIKFKTTDLGHLFAALAQPTKEFTRLSKRVLAEITALTGHERPMIAANAGLCADLNAQLAKAQANLDALAAVHVQRAAQTYDAKLAQTQVEISAVQAAYVNALNVTQTVKTTNQLLQADIAQVASNSNVVKSQTRSLATAAGLVPDQQLSAEFAFLGNLIAEDVSAPLLRDGFFHTESEQPVIQRPPSP